MKTEKTFSIKSALVALFMLEHIVKIFFMMLFHHSEVDVWLDKKVQVFAAFCMRVLRIDLTIEDQAMLGKVDWSRPVFVMGNHNSYSDIPVIFLAIERTVGFIAKKELQMVPFLSFWMRKVGCIFVNREKGGGAAKIREAMAKMKGSKVQSWYVFMDNKQSLHNTDCPSRGKIKVFLP